MAHDRTSSSGYPLITLFIVVAVCAFIIRLLTPLIDVVIGNREKISEIAFWMGLGLILTMILGAAVGLAHHRQPRGLLIGLSIGAVVGPVFGAMSLLPPDSGELFLVIAFVGAGTIIVVGVVMRMKTPEEPSTDCEQTEPKDVHPIDETSNDSTVD